MTPRQAYALAHPSTDPTDTTDTLNPALRALTQHPTRRDAQILTILAIDR